MNASDGTVEGEAQGDTSALDKFLQHLKIGPSAAKVIKVDHREIDAKTGDKGFQRYENPIFYRMFFVHPERTAYALCMQAMITQAIRNIDINGKDPLFENLFAVLLKFGDLCGVRVAESIKFIPEDLPILA